MGFWFFCASLPLNMFADAFAAYGTVFGLEMLILLAAFGLSFRLNLPASAAQIEERENLAIAQAD